MWDFSHNYLQTCLESVLQRIPVPFQRNIEHGFLQELFAYPMEGRKEMFYLTTHSTHFILRLYGVIHMVKNHLDFEGGNPLPPHGLLFPISSKILLYASSRRQNNTYHGLCYTSRGALAGTRNSSLTQWVPDMHVAKYNCDFCAGLWDLSPTSLLRCFETVLKPIAVP